LIKIVIFEFIMVQILFNFLTPIYNDAPEPWQLGFQDGGSPTHEGITALHDSIFFYLVVILFGVLWVLTSSVINFNSNKTQIVYKYANHGTLIELIWTVSPAFVLIAIAFPSFKLLYLMDSPENYIEHFVLLYSTPIVTIVNCKEVVKYGQGGNTLGIRRLPKYVMSSTICNNAVLSQLVGHLLGDGSINLSYTSTTPYFIFSQTLKRFNYVWHVFLRLYNYCATVPKINTSYRNNTITTNCQVHTRSYPFLLIVHNLFYKIDADGK
jgi:heme/copper-type cytochrome/quinol oxidase subunit 2